MNTRKKKDPDKIGTRFGMMFREEALMALKKVALARGESAGRIVRRLVDEFVSKQASA